MYPRQASFGAGRVANGSALIGGRLRRFGRRLADYAQYSFRDRWQIPGTVEQVSELLLDTQSMTRWWPRLSVVQVAEWGDRHGLQRSFSTRAKGFLPYSLQVDFVVVHVQFPCEFRVDLKGDLYGWGGGRLRQHGGDVAIDFELTVGVARPLLQVLSLVGRPVFRAQHGWLMRQGERGLHQESLRRRAQAAATAS